MVNFCHGPVGSSERSLCQDRNRPNASLAKRQENSRSTSSIPQTKRVGTRLRISRRMKRSKFMLAPRLGFQLCSGERSSNPSCSAILSASAKKNESIVSRCAALSFWKSVSTTFARDLRASDKPRARSEVLPIWRAPLIRTMLSSRAMAERKSSSVGRTM